MRKALEHQDSTDDVVYIQIADDSSQIAANSSQIAKATCA
jgi:hypothetical protein